MKLIIPFKLLSYNGYYRNTKSGHRVKTGAGLAYDEELDLFLEDNEASLISYGWGIDLSSNILELKIRIFNSNFYIKDGSRLNESSGDIDNYVKILQDKLFKVMKLNDVYVKRLIVEEYPSDIDLAEVSFNTLLLSSHLEVPTYRPE